MKIFRSTQPILRGTSLAEVTKTARREYHRIQKKTPRRQAYIRARYFRREKVFINQFWIHIAQKHSADQLRRLRFYSCALELLRSSTYPPTIKANPNKTHELLYRFLGTTKEGQIFAIQVKENTRTKRKDFMSVFPYKI